VDKPVKIEKDSSPFCGLDGAGKERIGLKRIGTKWLETSLHWHEIEKEKGKYNFGETIPDLKAAGYKVKVVIVGVPQWAWNKEELKEAKKWNMSPRHSGLLPAKDKMNDWQTFLKKAAKKYGNSVDIWEIGAEDDLRWGRNAFYRKKYSKDVQNTFAVGAFAERVADFYDRGIEALRSVLPNCKIGVIRPSGVDSLSQKLF
jgi:hypothetical protein